MIYAIFKRFYATAFVAWSDSEYLVSKFVSEYEKYDAAEFQTFCKMCGTFLLDDDETQVEKLRQTRAPLRIDKFPNISKLKENLLMTSDGCVRMIDIGSNQPAFAALENLKLKIFSSSDNKIHAVSSSFYMQRIITQRQFSVIGSKLAVVPPIAAQQRKEAFKILCRSKFSTSCKLVTILLGGIVKNKSIDINHIRRLCDFGRGYDIDVDRVIITSKEAGDNLIYRIEGS